MSDATARFGLPLLAAGQAQKEIVHNEALLLLDELTQCVVEAVGAATPPSAPLPGQSWIVGTGATGAWIGQAGALAAWTAGGWRFVAPVEGMRVTIRSSGLVARRRATSWISGAAVASPSAGSVIDSQARTAIGGIIAALQQGGLIAP